MFLSCCVRISNKTNLACGNKNKHYASWVGLNASLFAKHLSELEETWKDNSRKIKSGLRSTREAIASKSDRRVTTNSIQKKENCIFVKTYDLHDNLGFKMCTDQSGRFTEQSYRGNQYIMVLIELDGNSILIEVMQNRISGKMIRVY